jgi:hypothetical protein
MNQTQEINTLTYSWDVKILDSLRKPVTLLAVQSEREIRDIVTQAVAEYLKKQENLTVMTHDF